MTNGAPFNLEGWVGRNENQPAHTPELLEALKVADRLLDSFVRAAKSGDVAEVSMGAFREMAAIKECLAKAESGAA